MKIMVPFSTPHDWVIFYLFTSTLQCVLHKYDKKQNGRMSETGPIDMILLINFTPRPMITPSYQHWVHKLELPSVSSCCSSSFTGMPYMSRFTCLRVRFTREYISRPSSCNIKEDTWIQAWQNHSALKKGKLERKATIYAVIFIWR